MTLYVIYFVCTVLAYGECATSIIGGCNRTDPAIETCILERVEEIRPSLKGGIPEVKLPPLDPFEMDYLEINSTVIGARVKAAVTHIHAQGGSDFKIEYLKVDLDNKYSADLEIVFPRLKVAADYNTRGSRLLFFVINGTGKFKGNFSNVSVVAKCVATPFSKDGVEYLQVDSITTKVSIGEAELDVNPTEWSISGSAASSFIRSSPSVVLKVFAPVIDETAASIVKQYINDVLASVPLRTVLLE